MWFHYHFLSTNLCSRNHMFIELKFMTKVYRYSNCLRVKVIKTLKLSKFSNIDKTIVHSLLIIHFEMYDQNKKENTFSIILMKKMFLGKTNFTNFFHFWCHILPLLLENINFFNNLWLSSAKNPYSWRKTQCRRWKLRRLRLKTL